MSHKKAQKSTKPETAHKKLIEPDRAKNKKESSSTGIKMEPDRAKPKGIQLHWN